jgi:hypothetical protein
MRDINRRTFVSTGAAFLTTTASLLLLQEATGATREALAHPLRESERLPSPSHHHTLEETLAMEGHSMGRDMKLVFNSARIVMPSAFR